MTIDITAILQDLDAQIAEAEAHLWLLRGQREGVLLVVQASHQAVRSDGEAPGEPQENVGK